MKKLLTVSAVIALILIVSVPFTIAASPVLRSGEAISITESQEVLGDFYAAGGTVSMSGAVAGDLYAAGGTVALDGEVAEDVVVFGGSVQIAGAVGDDVRVIGGEATISGEVEGDVLVLGGIVRILETSQIRGDVLFLGGEVSIEGTVNGSVTGRAEGIRIDGPVMGDVSITSARPLELGDRANIDGDVEYRSLQDVVRAPGSVVAGDVTKKETSAAMEASSFSMLSLLILFFTSLVYLFLFKKKLDPFMRETMHSFGKRGAIGLATIVAVPVAVVILMITVIGMPIGIALASALTFLSVIAWSLGGIFLGVVLARLVEGQATLTLKWTLVGTLVFGLFSYIPFIGGLLIAVVVLIVLGSMVRTIYIRIRRA